MTNRCRNLAAVALTSLAASGCATPPRADVPKPIEPELRFVLPGGGDVFVPGSLSARSDAPAILVHFHGATSVVEREFAAAGLRAVLVTVNYRGLSAAYEAPLTDPQRFATILYETLAELKLRGQISANARWRKICLSSFSAGYGAVRAILRRSEHFEQVDAIYLADSLYAGYDEQDGRRPVDPENMTVFRKFAAEAAADRKFLLITHSYLEPGRYAGTHETADDLIAHVGAVREPVDQWIPDSVSSSKLHVISTTDAEGFHVRGCAGNTGDDHMAHLRNLRWGLAMLPLGHP